MTMSQNPTRNRADRPFDGARRDQEDGARRAAVLLTGDREKPHDEAAEGAVLGAMLLDSNATAVALSQLNFEGAFYRQSHQLIFNAIAALNQEGSQACVDPVVLVNHLKRNNQLEAVGGQEYLTLLADQVPTAANVDRYVEIVKQTAILRRIIATCSEAILKCYENDGDTSVLLDSIEQEIMGVSQMKEHNDYREIEPLAKEVYDQIVKMLKHESNNGIPTGYDTLDKAMTGGLAPGMLFILAARPSIGKTALALNMAANIALRGDGQTPVGIFSLEMSAQQLVMRLVSAHARVNVNRWAYSQTPTTAELTAVRDACTTIGNSKVVIDDTGGIDILELRAKARRMVEKHHVQVIFVDYLQLITINTGNRNSSRENDVARVSGALKALAKELQIPIVVLSQLNRQAEQGDAKPKLSNLRESGAIEQDADVVTLLHRKREAQFGQQDDAQTGLEAELIIAKNRNGRTCRQLLTFFPQFTRFDPREEEASAEELPS